MVGGQGVGEEEACCEGGGGGGGRAVVVVDVGVAGVALDLGREDAGAPQPVERAAESANP